MARAVVQRYDRDTGSFLGTIASELSFCETEYNTWGGCRLANLTFVVPFASSFVTDKTEELRVIKDGETIFSGPVLSIKPELSRAAQKVSLDGWYRRLDEIEIVSPPTDHISFGFDGADFPEIKTAFGVFEWVLNERILPDAKSPITEGLVQSAAATCKLGPSGFFIYANDKLTKVVETLALLDDCVCGVGADRGFYFFPRQNVMSSLLLTIPIGEDIHTFYPNWRNSKVGVVSDGSFIEDRRGPNYVALQGRDINGIRGTRTYKLLGTTQDGTRRIARPYSPNIRHGQAGRRYAIGIFRRFTDYGLKVEDLSFTCGTQRLEPHLGRVVVKSFGDEVASKIVGTIRVSWLDAVKGSVTLGENKPELGSSNPINDPAAQPDNDSADSAQIDTGDTAEIDFDDGFDGDGDDLHTNEDRETWEDPAGPGVTALDYGEDTADEDNGSNSTQARPHVWLAGITDVHVPVDPEEDITYDVDIIKKDGTTVLTHKTGLKTWPEAKFALSVAQKVIVIYPEGDQTKAVIDGAAACVLWPGMVVGANVSPPFTYQVDIFDPADVGYTNALATYAEVPTWPDPEVAFDGLTKVAVLWLNNQLNPVIMTTGSGESSGGHLQSDRDLGIYGTMRS